MITHLLFKGLNSFNIGSNMFRKILAVIVAILIFALVFLAVKFTKVEVPNFNRNLIMLAVVDISAFGLVMWKFGSPTEKRDEEKEKVESVAREEVIVGEKETETTSSKKKEAEAGEGDEEGDEARDEARDEEGDEARDEARDEEIKEAGEDVEEDSREDTEDGAEEVKE